MSSSSSSISRSRSLRKPLINNNNTINTNNASNGSAGSGVVDGAAAAAGSNVRDGGGPTPRTLSPTRLPVKGVASSSLARSAAIRTVSTASSTAGGGASSSSATETKRTRPLSGILGRSRQESVSKEKEANTTTTGGSSTSRDVLNSRPPRTATTRAAIGGTGIGHSRPPSSSGPLTRSNSMARPTTSSGVPNSSNARPARAPSGHARTKSSITTLTGATTLRPPSQTSADSGGSSAGASVADRSRPPITRSAAATTHKRNISNPTAAASSRTLPTTTATSKQPPPPSTTSTSTSSRHSPTSTDPLPAAATDHHRPAFNTHQQHYSPAKSLAPKPLTSTFLAPPSPSKLPSNVALSAEIARLQTELLQLHLLHRDSSAVDGQWRSSARLKLGERFTTLVKEESHVAKLEESVVEMGNLKALVEWGAAGGVEGLEGRIQMLDEVLCGVWGLGEPAGRYTRVVRRFEKWMGRAREVSEARRLFDRIRRGEGEGEKVTAELLGDEGLADLLLLMTGDSQTQVGKNKGQGQGQVPLLDAEWKEECAMLTRRLTEWRRILNGLMMIPPPTTEQKQHQDDMAGGGGRGGGESSLAKILKACSNLVDDMLAELKLMEQTERDAVVAENAWVRAVNRDQDEHGESLLLPSQRGGAAGNSTRAGAIWRAF